MSDLEWTALVVTLAWFSGLFVGHLIHHERRADRKHRKAMKALGKATTRRESDD